MPLYKRTVAILQLCGTHQVPWPVGKGCPLQIRIRLNKYTRPCVKDCYAFIIQCNWISSELLPQTPQRSWLRSHNTILKRCCLTRHNTQLHNLLHNLLIPTAVLSKEYELEYNSCSLPRRSSGKKTNVSSP